jgi:hypothetical protein
MTLINISNISKEIKYQFINIHDFIQCSYNSTKEVHDFY